MAATVIGDGRRFGGFIRLIGEDVALRIAACHVCIVGVGGVGSWAAEALARSAVGEITLIDLDHVTESNTNRQVHALDGEFGRAKVIVMAARIRAISPVCNVNALEEFVTPENVDAVIPACDAVLDATDNIRAKAALLAYCRRKGIPAVTTGGAGGKLDPTRIEIADLARTTQDSLASKLRAHLRRDYGYSRNPKHEFGVDCVFSTEPIRRPVQRGEGCLASNLGLAGLNCSGYGSAVAVTASFGFVAASRILEILAYSTQQNTQETT